MPIFSTFLRTQFEIDFDFCLQAGKFAYSALFTVNECEQYLFYEGYVLKVSNLLTRKQPALVLKIAGN